MIDLKAIEAWERWWNTKPEPHIPAPKQCAMNQDKMMAVWLSAWDAATKQTAAENEMLDSELTREIQRRDSYHEWADRMANAIGAHFDCYIGEHSSENNPWENAMVCIESPQPEKVQKHRKPASKEFFKDAFEAFAPADVDEVWEWGWWGYTKAFGDKDE